MEKSIKVLEFKKILETLAGYALTAGGKKIAAELAPASDKEAVRRRQQETTEAVILLRNYSPGLCDVPDVRKVLALAGRGGMLNEADLAGILKLLLGVKRLQKFFSEKEEKFPLSFAIVSQMTAPIPLQSTLVRTVDEEACLLDSASPELASLRKAIKSAEERLRERFDSFVRSSGSQHFLQESLVTVRNERLVVPVRQEYKCRVPGVVHDRSSSGATFFIEPLWAVEINNKLNELRARAEQEREKILRAVSISIGAESEALTFTYNLYAEMDFMLAKGSLSLHFSAVEPSLCDDGSLKIVCGRHPHLGREAVPISLEMQPELRTLVITGPNTGGKTVALKTVGIFALMAQSGLHLPAEEGTTMPVFSGIYADIGDEQDIAQSLSTFSGHMKNIVRITREMEEGSLVLLDELGAGTDPVEGAALAVGLLDYLYDYGALTLVTSHFSQLKVYAHKKTGMQNAAVEFDVTTLAPTYRLLVGVPGKSNAFTIAARLGLPDGVIKRGQDLLSKEGMALSEMVDSLAEERKKMTAAYMEAEQKRLEAARIEAVLEKERKEFLDQQEETLRKAREDASVIVSRARKESQMLLKQLRKLSAQSSAKTPDAKELNMLAGKLESLTESLAKSGPSIKGGLAAAEIDQGQEVFVNSLGRRGIVVNVEGEAVSVQLGSMRVGVTASDLSPVPAAEKKSEGQVTTTISSSREVSGEIDLRGTMPDEAVMRVESYLSEALIAGLTEVRLIHGKGTGRLRAEIRSWLHTSKLVKEFRTGFPAEGGTGVTVVSV